MLQGLSHSDSYTWAVENRRPSSGRSINREDSFSSLSSQDVSLTNLCPDYTHTESQVLNPFSKYREHFSGGKKWFLFYTWLSFLNFFLVLHSSANFPHHVYGKKPVCYSSWGTMKVHNKVFFTVALGHVLISDAHLHVSDFYSLFNLKKNQKRCIFLLHPYLFCYLRGVI